MTILGHDPEGKTGTATQLTDVVVIHDPKPLPYSPALMHVHSHALSCGAAFMLLPCCQAATAAAGAAAMLLLLLLPCCHAAVTLLLLS